MARDEDDATVRISYERGAATEQELVTVHREDDRWMVLPAPLGG